MMSVLLQEMDNEDQRVGWNIKNKIKFPIRKLYFKKLWKKMRHRMRDLLIGKGAQI